MNNWKGEPERKVISARDYGTRFKRIGIFFPGMAHPAMRYMIKTYCIYTGHLFDKP
jgi:hypothetical protein